MKRLFDLILAVVAIFFMLVPFIFIWLAVRFTSQGPTLFWSDRIGKGNVIFRMPKFRTMKLGTPLVASHLLVAPKIYLTPIGSFLRKTSLDEIPQLWNILIGNMSFVGPRPSLCNEHDLIFLRMEAGVDQLLPGLTGWAQVNGRDELTVSQKVDLDVEYMKHQSLFFDITILWMTFLKVIRCEGVSH